MKNLLILLITESCWIKEKSSFKCLEISEATTYWRTMSPSGFSGTYASTWYLYGDGRVGGNYYTSNATLLRPVINLKSDTPTSGSGTSTDPFIIN